MERTCKKCGKNFEPDFSTQVNCAECKKKQNERKQKSRAGQEAAREAKRIPSAAEYTMPQAQQAVLSEAVRSYTEQIRSELGDHVPAEDDLCVIGNCVYTVVGYEKNFVKRVSDPTGVLVGGIYPDACVNNVVSHVRLQHNLLQSKTFEELYKKFLMVAKKLSQTYEAVFEPKYAEILNQELNGTYAKPEPTFLSGS
jgi:hypothetical protein